MDALAGYGSDSDNSDQAVPSPSDNPTAGVSSLLGHYSGDDSDEDNSGIRTSTKQIIEGEKNGCQQNAKGEGAGQRANDDKQVHTSSHGQPTNKRRRRWDNPNEDVLPDVIPPPTLLTDTTNQDPYHSLALFQKDYTTSLRHKLSQQLQIQSQTYETGGAASMENQQLIQTLERLHDQFQQKKLSHGGDAHSAATPPTSSSFAAHLKSKREFGNPHLLKTVIDHFHIQPLESHVGNTFKEFEYMDRLISAEERARAAAINYDAIRGGDAGRMSGSGD